MNVPTGFENDAHSFPDVIILFFAVIGKDNVYLCAFNVGFCR